MEKITLNVKKWIKANRKEFYILAFILILAAFFRLFKIDQYMTFLGDEGRDVIIVRRFLTELHPPLIGPGTSIGNMYLGPFYYYFMAPALLIAGFSPLGPAVLIALLGIFTVWFVWYIGRLWFGKTAGIIAAFLYAISPTVIIYSRSSWNPNIMPFFALLAVFAGWKFWKERNSLWLYVLSASFAAVLQSHYLGLLLGPTLAVYWFLSIKDKWNKKSERVIAIKSSLKALLLFLILMSPLMLFDMRHGWVNTKAMYTFFTVRQTTVSIRPWTAIPKVPESFQIINTSLVGGRNEFAGKAASVIIAVGVALFILYSFRKGNKNFYHINAQYLLLMAWMLFAIIGFGLYKQNIYDHYYGFIFPVPFLAIGIIAAYLLKGNAVKKALAITGLVYLISVNLSENPLKYPPNNQLGRAYNVAQKIKEESGGKPFNLGVIAERNYEDGYKYFLLKEKQPVVNIDSQVEGSIKDQLFAVCELPKEKCDPTHNATASIANFGWSTIAGQWEVDGVIIYKLIHTETQKK
jgi:4-amino-4-deoxy-L-arabinose transferase-like glycosyltransferase